MRTLTLFFRSFVSLAIALSVSAMALADEPLASIEGEIPEDLSALIYEVMGTAEKPPRSTAQARRRMQQAAKSARSVLRSQGYYSADINVRILEQTSDKQTNEARPARAVLTVNSDPQFTYDTINIEFLDTNFANAGDAIETKLKSKAIALAAPVVAEELRLINMLKTMGYPDTIAESRSVTVDHKTAKMDVTFKLKTGVKTRFGTIKQTGSAYLVKSWTKMVSPFEAGELYDSRKMSALSSRVIGTGIFESATATLTDDAQDNADGTVTRNILLNIEQGPINSVVTELGYSTTDGTGASLVYERKNFIGYAQTLRLTGVAKTNQISAGIGYNIPYAWRADRELDLSLLAAKENTDAFEGERLTGNAFVTQKISKTFKLGIGLGLEASKFNENGQDITSYLVDGLGRATFDNRNSIFDPQKGIFVEATLTPTYNFGENNGQFATATLGASTYKRLSKKVTLAGRAKIGSILTTSFDAIPLNRRFYGGGGGSVRGFAYQSISPEDVNGDLTGGRSLSEVSTEVRYRGDSAFGFAAFVDAGSVTQKEYPTLSDIRAGAGLGVRYYTNFAPLRADIAIPLNKREGDSPVQVYISIGQAF